LTRVTEVPRAFRDECGRLSAVLRTLDRADLDRPTGWDQLTLIRKAAGRAPRDPAEQDALDRAGIRLLSFGR
jgi:hypothetical protein